MKKRILLILVCLCLIGVSTEVLGMSQKQTKKFINDLEEYVYLFNKAYHGMNVDEITTFDEAVVSEEQNAVVSKFIVNEDKADMDVLQANADKLKASIVQNIPSDVKKILKEMNWSYIYYYVGDTSYKEVIIQIFWNDL